MERSHITKAFQGLTLICTKCCTMIESHEPVLLLMQHLGDSWEDVNNFTGQAYHPKCLEVEKL